ncbi:MAG: hypothetical protein AB8I40_06445 [Anaerolineales bacterium]
MDKSINRDGLRYAREKLGVAVWKLATGIDGIKDRLSDAYIELAIIQESDLPIEFVIDWKEIRNDLTSGKMQYITQVKDGKLVKEPVGKLASTLRFMRKKKAVDIAKRICHLEARLDRYIKVLDNSAS